MPKQTKEGINVDVVVWLSHRDADNKIHKTIIVDPNSIVFSDKPTAGELQAAVKDKLLDTLKISGDLTFRFEWPREQGDMQPLTLWHDVAKNDDLQQHAQETLSERLRVKVKNGREALAQLKQLRATRREALAQLKQLRATR